MAEQATVEALVAQVRALVARRDLEAARPMALDLVSRAPGDAGALFLAGVVSAERGDLLDARTFLERSFAIQPSQQPSNHLIYANVLLDAGDAPLGEKQAREVLAKGPASAMAFVTLAQALRRQGRLDEAIDACSQALAVDPTYRRARALAAALRWTRARALHGEARVFGAIDEYRASLALDDTAADKWNDLGNALVDAGFIGEAQEAYREALRRDPAYHQVESNLLVSLHYDPSIGAQRMYNAHREWAARHAPRATDMPLRRSIAPNDRIRIGFMSPALRTGPTGAFLAPLIENLDPKRFAIHCYRTAGSTDAVTARLKAASVVWRDLIDADDDALFAALRADELDVLVDLAGHTPGGRLRVLARKPAPIVATWLDYFDTTGLDSVDYLIGDPVSTPRGGPQGFSETLALIEPCRLCYSPPPYAPAVAPPPLARNGYATFGSFNRLSKLSNPTLDLWARLLHEVPSSRLLLKYGAFVHPRYRARAESLFVARGIGPERLQFRTHSPHEALLAEYGDVDIALDPFPYNGGLTTCEALWMGVPVLGLMGDSMISRQTASLLNAAGFPQWAVRTPDEFVELARAMAGDAEGLARTRAAVRPTVAASPLVNGKYFAQNFATAVEGWVRGSPKGP